MESFSCLWVSCSLPSPFFEWCIVGVALFRIIFGWSCHLCSLVCWWWNVFALGLHGNDFVCQIFVMFLIVVSASDFFLCLSTSQLKECFIDKGCNCCFSSGNELIYFQSSLSLFLIELGSSIIIKFIIILCILHSQTLCMCWLKCISVHIFFPSFLYPQKSLRIKQKAYNH